MMVFIFYILILGRKEGVGWVFKCIVCNLSFSFLFRFRKGSEKREVGREIFFGWKYLNINIVWFDLFNVCIILIMVVCVY